MEHRIAISFKNVSFSYKNIKVLENISFHIHENEFVSLIGPNGAGKTTILKLILGLLLPDGGEIKIFGNSPFRFTTLIGYVPQNLSSESSLPITVEEIIEMGLLNGFDLFKKSRYREKLEKSLELMEIKNLKKRQYNELSGGEKRRVLLARALVSEPKILILDEPTTNMDGESEDKLFHILENLKRSTTIIVVTHDTEFVSELTDVVLCTGKENEKAHKVIRHNIEVIKDLENKKIFRVLHNTELKEDCCCKREE
ncbi:MAG: ATP-binding cassette domain-containing protein [Brevinematales bacterium]|nr:ATP-binding cassette domain-containing protein [Brevinematales bacterium]